MGNFLGGGIDLFRGIVNFLQGALQHGLNSLQGIADGGIISLVHLRASGFILEISGSHIA